MKQESKNKEFNEKFLGSYQQEQSDPTNKNHQFDSEKTTADGQSTTPATATPAAAQELAASVTKPAGNLSDCRFHQCAIAQWCAHRQSPQVGY